MDWLTDFKPGNGMGREASKNIMAYNQSFWSSPSGRQRFGKQIKSPKGKYSSIFLVPLTPRLSLLCLPKERKPSDAQLFQAVDRERGQPTATRIAHRRGEMFRPRPIQNRQSLLYTPKFRHMPNHPVLLPAKAPPARRRQNLSSHCPKDGVCVLHGLQPRGYIFNS